MFYNVHRDQKKTTARTPEDFLPFRPDPIAALESELDQQIAEFFKDK